MAGDARGVRGLAGPGRRSTTASPQWRDIGVLAALMEGMIAEVARRGQADMSLVSVGSTVARAHHDAAGMVVEPEVLAALEGAAAREKGPRKPGKLPRWPTARRLGSASGPSADGCVGAAGPPGWLCLRQLQRMDYM